MWGYPRRDIDYQEAVSILKPLVNDQGERGRRPVKHPSADQIGGVIRRDSDQGLWPGFRFVVYPQDDATTVRICKTNSGVGEHHQGVLRTLRWLLEIELLPLEIPCRDAVSELLENLVNVG